MSQDYKQGNIFFDAVLLALAIILGIVLAVTGKPFNTAVFTVHKLAALAATVFTFIICLKLFKNDSISGIYVWVIAVAVVVTIVLFISGAFISANSPAYHSLRIIHIFSSILLTACDIAIIVRLIDKLLQ